MILKLYWVSPCGCICKFFYFKIYYLHNSTFKFIHDLLNCNCIFFITGYQIARFYREWFVQKHKTSSKRRSSFINKRIQSEECGGEFSTSSFPYKLAILRRTKTKSLTDFPDEVLEKYFTDFGKILDEKYERNVLIDNNIIMFLYWWVKELFLHNYQFV